MEHIEEIIRRLELKSAQITAGRVLHPDHTRRARLLNTIISIDNDIIIVKEYALEVLFKDK